jgi:hypothetical protein
MKDKELDLLILPKPKNFIDMLLESKMESRLPAMRELAGRLGSIEGMLKLRGQPVWAILPYRMTVR